MRPKKLALIALSVGALIVVAVATGAVRPTLANRDSRPPCDQLPTRQQAERALANHAALKERIIDEAGAREVEVAMPCDPDNRALIRVTYSGDAQRSRILGELSRIWLLS